MSLASQILNGFRVPDPKNTGVCCHGLLQGIFLIHGTEPTFLNVLYYECHLGSPLSQGLHFKDEKGKSKEEKPCV